MTKDVKIAIVYDWIDKWGGIERMLLVLDELLPGATFFTSYYDPIKAQWSGKFKIMTSFMQRFPDFIKQSRVASLPFYPYVFESFDFSRYDLVISVSSAFAKSVITKPETPHICFLLTPARYLWIEPQLYLPEKIFGLLLRGYISKIREWDYISAQRPDYIISISKTVSQRCKKYYQRDSDVIYPPFDFSYWNKIKSKVKASRPEPESQKFFLLVSRLEPYKRIDLVIQLIKQLNQRLIIVGEGTQSARLKKMSTSNIIFLTKLSDLELGSLYNRAEALIMPQEEDFGYTSLEAQFFGCPVIAFVKGGAGETVIEGKTGIFFAEQKVDSLVSAIRKFNMVKYKLKNSVNEFGVKNTEKFSKANFARKFLNFLYDKVNLKIAKTINKN